MILSSLSLSCPDDWHGERLIVYVATAPALPPPLCVAFADQDRGVTGPADVAHSDGLGRQRELQRRAVVE
jgi:hypothetical protein